MFLKFRTGFVKFNIRKPADIRPGFCVAIRQTRKPVVFKKHYPCSIAAPSKAFVVT